MVKQIKTSITKKASKEKIWKILTDFENYPEWNSFIESVIGEVKVGNQIQIKSQGMTFNPIVLTLNENTELKWLGHLWFKGLLTENKLYYDVGFFDQAHFIKNFKVFYGVIPSEAFR